MDHGIGFMKDAATVDVVSIGAEGSDAPDAAACLAHLARHDVDAHPVRLAPGARHAGTTILHYCDKVGADLLIMGAYSRSRLGEAVSGGTSHLAITQSPVPLLMSH